VFKAGEAVVAHPRLEAAANVGPRA
jgi:hypothetical protein